MVVDASEGMARGKSLLIYYVHRSKVTWEKMHPRHSSLILSSPAPFPLSSHALGLADAGRATSSGLAVSQGARYDGNCSSPERLWNLLLLGQGEAFTPSFLLLEPMSRGEKWWFKQLKNGSDSPSQRHWAPLPFCKTDSPTPCTLWYIVCASCFLANQKVQAEHGTESETPLLCPSGAPPLKAVPNACVPCIHPCYATACSYPLLQFLPLSETW